ncbi:MAG TPA: 50S ribosomal protein L25/general stress protein Ctc [Bacteroidales bacterium]|nr:50S ribosomal protein L25/general stress protein Ctc [Bacteroidales bacterium]
MKTFDLAGKVRQEVGKKATKEVRKSGTVPCVLYGGGENVHFTVTESAIHRLIYTPHVYMINLTVGGKSTKAIMKDLQFHPVSDKVLHIDFLEVNEDKPVVVELPVKLTGLAAGVKAGGKLSLEMRKLRVKGLYKDLPENITLDVTKLSLGKSIQVGSISLENIELMNAKNAVVAQVKLTCAARGAAATAASEEEKEE